MRKTAALLAALILAAGLGPARAAIDESAQEVLYRATASGMGRILDQPDGKTIRYVRKGYHLEILGYDPKYLYVRCYGETGYLLRDRAENVYALDEVNTPPYGLEIFACMTRLAGDLPVLSAPEEGAETLITLHEGAVLGLIGFENGWGKVIFKRQYGYVDGRLLTELTQVRGDAWQDLPDSPLAVYTSYYNIAQTEVNLGRMNNIEVACRRLQAIELSPGERLNFNTQVGPYKASVGYQPAPILANGTTSVNYGGGTCQVSSTLYNAVLQLPGISVTQRRPHGPSGASYVPHGMDAAVGNTALNLILRNDYDFPIRFEATAQDGALTISVWQAGESSQPL